MTMKVIIDSGHGGNQPGAVAFGMMEKDLNLILAKMLAVKLQQAGLNTDTSLLVDKYHSSDELCSLIKKSGAALCISCHCNAADGKAKGFEAIYSIHTDGYLANLMVTEVKATGFPVRRAYSKRGSTSSNYGKDYYFIIRETYPEVETVLVEFGFMDNSEDFSKLTNPVWQDKLTQAVANAVKKYLLPNSTPSNPTSKTSIVGEALLKETQLKKALLATNPDADASIVDAYYRIAKVYGIKADLAFLQSMKETNWLRFTGVVKPQQNNFAGLGATGGGNPGESFPARDIGIEAHIQHLYAYCSVLPLPAGKTLYDTRFNYVKRGSAVYWEDLNGKWAVPGIGYGESIISLQKSVSEKYPEEKPPTPPVDNPTQPAPVHWAKACNDELMEAGLLFNDHTEFLDQPATEGMVLCLVNRLRKELKKDE